MPGKPAGRRCCLPRVLGARGGSAPMPPPPAGRASRAQLVSAGLSHMVLAFSAHAFPDRHAFRAADLEFAECDFVLMTEKDAVKCRHFGRRDLIAVRVDAELDPALAELILERIHGRATA